jgi:hypothetical protein
MLASGSLASVEAADLPACAEQQRTDLALVSFVVSFSYVRNRSARTTEDGQPRSRTVATYAVPSRADLESVLAGKTAMGYASHRAIRSHSDVLGPHRTAVRHAGRRR